jgi:hypothetical protein
MSTFAALASLLRGSSASTPQPSGSVPGTSFQVTHPSKIGTLFVFQIPAEADSEFVSDLMRRAATPESTSFLQFLRVKDEPFGIAEFRTASAAYRAARALNGVPFLGRKITAVCDKRTLLLVDQWKYARGRELASAPGVTISVSTNIMELVETDVAAHVTKNKPELLEFVRATELRLKSGHQRGGDDLEKLRRKERDRVQEMLVRQAEAQATLEHTKLTLKDLASQVRKLENQLEANDRELDKREKEFVPTTARQHGGASLFTLKSMMGTREELLEGGLVDWEYICRTSLEKQSIVMQTMRDWLEKKLADAMGGRVFPSLVEYILRRLVDERVSPNELVLDLKNFIDDEAEIVVEGLWRVLVFESLRRRNCPRISPEPVLI